MPAPAASGAAPLSAEPAASVRRTAALPTTSSVHVEQPVVPTGLGELDRTLGGGLVPGAVVLLAGEPGVGKSTVLLVAAARAAASGRRVLYVSGEESTAQVHRRATRVGALDDRLWLAAESDLGALVAHVDDLDPALLVVDSVQTLTAEGVEGTAGGVAQVRAVAAGLVALAKGRGLATVVVGHVTKDGSVAGPRTLEHLVDVVVLVQGEGSEGLRTLRAVKNRFGPVDETGCVELVDDGVREVPDPSGLLTPRRDRAVPGTCLTVAREGRRPLLAEVQALTAGAPPGQVRRTATGLDPRRLAVVLALLQRHAGLRLGEVDVYAATAGGLRLVEPVADLALALAVASAHRERPLPHRLVALGELGLAGDVRRVGGTAARVTEARRAGGGTVLLAADGGEGGDPGTVGVDDLRGALAVCGLLDR